MILRSGQSASVCLNPFEPYPQILKNLKVEEKKPLEEIEGLEEMLEGFRKEGLRDLIRYSGTENKIRLLLEGKNPKAVKEAMSKLEDLIKKALA